MTNDYYPFGFYASNFEKVGEHIGFGLFVFCVHTKIQTGFSQKLLGHSKLNFV